MGLRRNKNKKQSEKQKRRDIKNLKISLHEARNSLVLADVHAQETIQKLLRECKKKKCKISKATRDESEGILSNLEYAEDYILNTVELKASTPSLKNKTREWSDRIRGMRQELAKTGTFFRSNVAVKRNSIDKIEDIRRKLKKLISEIDKHV